MFIDAQELVQKGAVSLGAGAELRVELYDTINEPCSVQLWPGMCKQVVVALLEIGSVTRLMQSFMSQLTILMVIFDVLLIIQFFYKVQVNLLAGLFLSLRALIEHVKC